MKQRCSTIRTNLEERTYELRSAFNLFDLDNDGKITLEELGAIFSVMGEALTYKELRSIIKEANSEAMDKDYITFEDFCFVMNSKMSDNATERELAEAFKVFDREGNGYITTQELKHVMLKVADELTEEEVDAMIKQADVNGDGQIEYEEFIALLMNKT